MKITAKVVPYSSVVGSSVTLHAESGMTICQLSLLSVIPPNFTFTPELHKQTSTRIAEWVAGALNGAAEFDASSALENGKAALADAHSKSLSSDLSSLRKGAEVVAWRYRYIRSGVPAPWMVTTRVEDTMGIDVESEPLFSAALVSGSREDGA